MIVPSGLKTYEPKFPILILKLSFPSESIILGAVNSTILGVFSGFPSFDAEISRLAPILAWFVGPDSAIPPGILLSNL